MRKGCAAHSCAGSNRVRAVASDAYGNSGNRLYTIACPAGVAPCRNQFGLVFSQLPSTSPNTFRSQLILFYEYDGGQPRLVYTLIGPLLQPGEQQAATQGGAVLNFVGPEG